MEIYETIQMHIGDVIHVEQKGVGWLTAVLASEKSQPKPSCATIAWLGGGSKSFPHSYQFSFPPHPGFGQPSDI